MNPKLRRSWAKNALTAVGLLIFAYLLHRIGLRKLYAHLLRFGPWFLATCLIALGWLFCQAVAWWSIQKAYFQRLPLKILYRLKIISDTFNMILPSANLGGDAMRVLMIKEDVPIKDGIPGVLFDKTTEFIGALLFLIAGLFLGLVTLKLPTSLTVPVSISLGVSAALIVLLVFVQKRGIVATLTTLGRLIPKARKWLAQHREQFASIDENFQVLYHRSNTKALPALAFQILSRLLGVVEVIVIMAVLRSHLSFVQALFVCTVVTAGNTVFFVLPGQWGVSEGLHVLVLQSLGYPAAIGLSLAIIRRVRKLAVAGLGLILFALEKRKSPRHREEA
jgi:uncharacterized membrane protein YbhN (UPF0104 family)